MRYHRDEHARFLEAELRLQTEEFRQKLDSSAYSLLQDRGEVFVAQFLKLDETRGQLILKFSNARELPRLKDHLYAFTVPKELRNYRDWGRHTYGDLIKAKLDFSEMVCAWHAPAEGDFSLAGFTGVDQEFADHIKGSPGIILVLGPSKPPYEYLANLQQVVQNGATPSVGEVLDRDFVDQAWAPELVDAKRDLASFFHDQLTVNDTVIVQGPPGTGKTHMIAQLCAKYLEEGASVLVTALTNRALLEVAEKPALAPWLSAKKVFKSNLTLDEQRTLPGLQQQRGSGPMPGQLVLATFFVVSDQAKALASVPPYDLVVVDEASQALLAMLAAAKALGKRNIWVGDVRQLPPVVATNEDKVESTGAGGGVDGLRALSACGAYAVYQLTQSHRLSPRAVRYTGIFYQNSLVSACAPHRDLAYPNMGLPWAAYFHREGGPTLLQLPMEPADERPRGAVQFVADLVARLCEQPEELSIAVLTYFVSTTKALQRAVFKAVGYRKDLVVETVGRVQGLTTDVAIYVVPNTGYYRSLERRVFNVATSRARRQTLIIMDPGGRGRVQLDTEVERYLRTLAADHAFHVAAGPLLGP